MTSLFQATGIMPHTISLLTTDGILGKKLSLIVFRHNHDFFTIFFHIFFTIMTYLKKLTRIKSLNTKQCPEGFSHKIIPSFPVSSLLPKDSKIKRFRLIITGSSSLFKGDGSWGFIFQKIEE